MAENNEVTIGELCSVCFIQNTRILGRKERHVANEAMISVLLVDSRAGDVTEDGMGVMQIANHL